MSDNPLHVIEELDIDAIIANANRRNRRSGDDDIIHQDPDKLREAYISFALSVDADFKPGDLLTWKPHWRNRRVPDYGQPCILIRVLESCIESEVIANNTVPVALDYANIEMAAFDDDGDIYLFLADSRRMMPWRDA